MLKNEETANTWISLKGLIQLKIAKFPIHTDTQIRKFTSQNSQIHTSHRQTNSQIHNLKQTNSQIHNLNRPNSHFTHTFQFTNSQHNLAKFTNSQLKMGQFTIHKKVFTPRIKYCSTILNGKFDRDLISNATEIKLVLKCYFGEIKCDVKVLFKKWFC